MTSLFKLSTLAATTLLLAACGVFDKKEPPPPCPRVSIISEGQRVTQFRPGPGRDITDIALEAQISGFEDSCTFTDKNQIVVTTALLGLVATRGPASQGEIVGDVPFFVAVINRDQQIIAKEEFSTRFAFRQGVRTVTITEELVQRLPLNGRSSRDYEIMIGLQLTTEQLEFIRRQQRGGR